MICRFDKETHTYRDAAGTVRPHITGMLERTGWIDDRWYTEESCERGTEIHRITADYDLERPGASKYSGLYRPYLLGHIEAMRLWPSVEILEVETAQIEPELGFGGRPDREILAWGAVAVLEGKSGAKEKAHGIQTALQAILVAAKYHLPAESIKRYLMYWTDKGAAKVYEVLDPGDFVKARKIIRECC